MLIGIEFRISQLKSILGTAVTFMHDINIYVLLKYNAELRKFWRLLLKRLVLPRL